MGRWYCKDLWGWVLPLFVKRVSRNWDSLFFVYAAKPPRSAWADGAARIYGVGYRHFYKKGHPYGCPFLVYISIDALLSLQWRLGRTLRGITFSDATRD